MKTEQNNTIRQERGCADRKQQEKPVRTRIKICGLTRLEDIQAVNEAKPDFCGFIVEFPKSRRNVTGAQLRTLREKLDESIRQCTGGTSRTAFKRRNHFPGTASRTGKRRLYQTA